MCRLKRIVITGGEGGLGQSIAEKFRDEEWDVLAIGRYDLDVRDGAAVRDFFSKVDCDMLVCCAGVVRDEVLFHLDEANWDEVLQVNYFGAHLCAKYAIEGMVAKGRGHIVFVSSYVALHPDVGQVAYASAKACLLGLTQDFARKYGSMGVRVNVVLPGFLETKMVSGVSEKRKDAVREIHVLGVFNQVDRVASFVRFLEEEMIYTSGQVFQLDSRLGD